MIGDTVYFIHNSTVYAMPVTGGEKTPISPYTNNWKLVPCGDRGILASAVGPKDTTVWYYDVKAGVAITISNITDSVENISGILDSCIDVGVMGIICFNMGMTLRSGNREYFYEKLDEHFPGLREIYEKKFGNSYGIANFSEL